MEKIYYPGNYVAGIPQWRMNQVYAPQTKDQWCWSACVSMLFNYYGMNVSQYNLAKNVCGVNLFGFAKNCPAPPFRISQTLNLSGTDYWGTTFGIYASLQTGQPDVLKLIQALEDEKPVMVAYYNPDYQSSHAILLTGCKYTVIGNIVYLTQLIARDPAKTDINQVLNGRRVITDVKGFLGSIHSYWYAEFYRYPAQRIAG